MTDELVRALAFEGQVRVFVIQAKDMVEEARQRHDTWYTATAALGRTLIGTALLAANLKGNDRMTSTIQGQGPIGRIHAEGDARGNVRGYVSNPKVALDANQDGKIDVKAAVGLPASLAIAKYIEDMKPFIGQVALVSGEIAEDFTYYMAASEQTPSSIGLSVLVNPDETVAQAGGFMLQLLPDADEETIVYLEEAIKSLDNLSLLLEKGTNMEELLALLVGESNYRIIDRMPVQFNCPCSKESFGSVIRRIETTELQAMIDEDHGAEVVCQYCNNNYHYSEEELIVMVKEQANELN